MSFSINAYRSIALKLRKRARLVSATTMAGVQTWPWVNRPAHAAATFKRLRDPERFRRSEVARPTLEALHATRILVACPGNTISGGPEVLHQLVDALRTLGHDAFISYYPFSGSFECPAPYRNYAAPQATFVDDPSNYVILPEVVTKFA
jgi:hypothetical protein